MLHYCIKTSVLSTTLFGGMRSQIKSHFPQRKTAFRCSLHRTAPGISFFCLHFEFGSVSHVQIWFFNLKIYRFKMKREVSQNCGAAANICFHYWLIHQLVSPLIAMSKKCEKCSSQFSRAQCDIFRFLLLSNNSPKHKNSSFIIINDPEKQEKVTIRRLNMGFVSLFRLKNDWYNY